MLKNAFAFKTPLLILTLALSVVACGGGGGSGSNQQEQNPPSIIPPVVIPNNRAKMVLSTEDASYLNSQSRIVKHYCKWHSILL